MSTTTSRNKTLVFIIALLLLTNIALIAYFMFFNKKQAPSKNKERENFTATLQREVGFSDAQIQQFNGFKEINWGAAKTGMEQIKQIKLRIFDLTKDTSATDAKVKMLADSIGVIQSQVEQHVFKHFRSIRQLCTPEQAPKFDLFIKKLIDRRQGKGSGKPDRNKQNPAK